MELVNVAMSWGGALLLAIVAFLFVLTVVVFVHEFGHFITARMCGVKVSAFSIGFGPEIFGFVDRHGTRWRLAWIPLGGYVKFMDDENGASVPDRDVMANMSAEERAGSFHFKPLWQRALVVAAGPIANYILAIFIFAGMFMTLGQQIIPAVVDEIQSGSAAEAAGLKIGDRIVSIDGTKIGAFSDMQRIASISADQKLTIVVLRNGKEVSIEATPRRDEFKDRFGNVIRRGLLGVRSHARPDEIEWQRSGPIQAIGLAVKETWFITTTTLGYLKKIIVGQEKADQLSGPIGIADTAGQMASVGIAPLIHLLGVLSVGIGLVNLFPIPMLDGGHLMFYAIEAVRQRPLSERLQEIGFRIGLAFVLMLMVFVTWGDVQRLAQKFF